MKQILIIPRQKKEINSGPFFLNNFPVQQFNNF